MLLLLLLHIAIYRYVKRKANQNKSNIILQIFIILYKILYKNVFYNYIKYQIIKKLKK